MTEKLLHFFFRFFNKSFLFVTVLFSIGVYAQYASVFENVTENQGLPSNYIFAMGEDQKGVMWLGSDKGLIKFFNGEFKVFDADSGLPGNYVNLLIPDGKKGLLLYFSEKGLYYFDTEKEKITVSYGMFGSRFPGLKLYKSPFDGNFLLIKAHLTDQVFAINTADMKKVVKLRKEPSLQQEDFYRYYLVQNGKKKLLADTETLYNKAEISDGTFDYQISYGKGVLRSQNGIVLDTLNESKGLGSSLISAGYKSRTGDIFYSSFGGGISVLRKYNKRAVFALENLKVRTINQENGRYYLLSDGFLYIMNRQKLLAKIFLKKDALTIFIKDNNLFLGSFSGLDHYLIEDNKVKHLDFFPLTAGISKIREHDGNILFSTYGRGIFQKLGNSYRSIPYPVFNNIENFFQNLDRSFVITSSESGFSLLNENLEFVKNFDKKDGLLSNNVTYTYGESDTLWVGTKRGLSAIVNNRLVRNYTHDEGFHGNIVRLIFRSPKNELWVVTDKMILKKIGQKLKPLGSLNFVGNEDYVITKSVFWKDLNELSIATEHNFSVINLDDIRPNTNAPIPILAEVYVDGKKVDLNSEVVLHADNFQTEFVFNPVDNDIIGKTQLYYKLDDGDWQLFTDQNKLKLHHLDHGRYKLMVKSLNTDGYEKRYPKDIHIKVNPNIYMTWWFIVLSVIGIGLIASLFIYLHYRAKYRERLNEIMFQEKLESERKRISRDLHDNIGAYTTSLINKVDQMQHMDKDQTFSGKINDIRQNAAYIMSLLRQTIWVLSSKETSLDGLFDNFVSYIHKFIGKESAINVKFIDEINVNRILDSSVTLSLFRIMQEAFHNILKHSEATTAEFHVDSNENGISITISDNGKGFDFGENTGNGLNNMNSRAEEIGFRLYIFSNSQGTVINIKEKSKRK